MTASRFFRSKFVHRAHSHSALFVNPDHDSVSGQWPHGEEEEAGIPAYNAGPPPKGTKLPAILTKDQLWGADAQYPYQTHAYELASKIPAVLHQQPCYCYCDRMGHNSLHSCFEGTHGARCATCLKELYYSYQQHKAGKTAAQIRAGIIKGNGSRSIWNQPRRLTNTETPASVSDPAQYSQVSEENKKASQMTNSAGLSSFHLAFIVEPSVLPFA